MTHRLKSCRTKIGSKARLRLSASSGVACLALGTRLAGMPGATERRAALAANRDEVSHAWWWPLQQLGTPGMLPLAALAAARKGQPRLALTAALALPIEKGAEVSVKRLLPRLRPAHAVPAVKRVDDAPADGPAYPSGHAAIATCLATLLWPHAGSGSRLLLVAGAAGAGYARVHQGAHYFGDVLGGHLLGLAVGSALPAADTSFGCLPAG